MKEGRLAPSTDAVRLGCMKEGDSQKRSGRQRRPDVGDSREDEVGAFAPTPGLRLRRAVGRAVRLVTADHLASAPASRIALVGASGRALLPEALARGRIVVRQTRDVLERQRLVVAVVLAT